MNGNVNLYDTYRANKDGKRYRVTEVGNETVKLVKLNDEGTRKHAGGRPRIMTVADLFRDFTKVDLPPVRVSKIEPQKPKQEEVEESGHTERERSANQKRDCQRDHQGEQFVRGSDRAEQDPADRDPRPEENDQQNATAARAEVADLKDRIMEAEAEANAVKKRKEEILKERTQYADALDNDSVAFDDILSLAETIQLVSTASAKLAKQIIAKTEGRI